MWSSGKNSWLQIQRSQVRFFCLYIFWEVVGLERGPVSLVSVIEELLEWKNSVSRSRKLRLTAVGILCADHAAPSISKSGAIFTDMRLSLGRYSSLAD
jgi:hypothetical protein